MARSKLTQEQCDSVRWFYRTTDMSMERIGKRYSVSGPTIAKIVDGKYKTLEQYRKTNGP